MKVKLKDTIYYSIVDKFLFDKSFSEKKQLNEILFLMHGESEDVDFFKDLLKKKVVKSIEEKRENLFEKPFYLIKYQKTNPHTNFIKVLEIKEDKEVLSKYINLL